MNRIKSTLFSRLTRAMLQIRRYSEPCGEGSSKKGLVVGAYDGCNPGEFKLTPSAEKVNEMTGGKLKKLIEGCGVRLGTARVFTNLSPEYYGVAVAGLGQEGPGFDSLEIIDQCKENIRIAAGTGAAALHNAGVTSIFVEGFTNTEAAAEGATLAVWEYTEHKNKELARPPAKIDLFEDPDRDGWQRGIIKAEAQNIARKLEETPSNLMTPTIFAQRAIDILCPCGVEVEVREKDWLDTKKLTAFLSMSKGSCEPPLLLELGYCGGNQYDRPVVICGKGITFDSGGLCLKKCDGMDDYRADMAGAAVTVAIFKAIASMNLPINVKGMVPLCENMPGGLAIKPGDVVMGLNGKTIRIEGTDKEGRIILADALGISKDLNPCLVITIGTLTGATKDTLGTSSTAVFTHSKVVWREMSRAGAETGDRVWRLPLWKYYKSKVTGYIGVDVNNVGLGFGGDPCIGASFLDEFVPEGADFIHMDITGTGMVSSGFGAPYLRKNFMTGRPTRTVVQFLYQMACPHDKGEEC